MALLYCFLNGEVSVCPHPNLGHHSGHRDTPRVPQSHMWDSSPTPCPPSSLYWVLPVSLGASTTHGVGAGPG